MLKFDFWILCSQEHTNHWNYIISNAFAVIVPVIWMIQTLRITPTAEALKKKKGSSWTKTLEQERKPAKILKFTFPKPQFKPIGGSDGAVFTRPEHIWPINNLANKLIPRDYKQILRGTRSALHLRRRINWPRLLRDWNKKRLDNWYPAKWETPTVRTKVGACGVKSLSSRGWYGTPLSDGGCMRTLVKLALTGGPPWK